MLPSETSLVKRLMSGAAVALVALTLAACSDDKQDTAATPASGETEQASAMDDAAAPAGVSNITTASTDTATGTAATTAQLPEAEGDVDMAEVLKPGALPEMALGEETAPVTIVEYMSMTCPHCATFHNNTFDAIKTKYVDSGKVRFIVREFPFDPRAAAAFMLARCAPEGQYFPMVSLLMKQQEAWAGVPNDQAYPALLQMAKLAGFTQESFDACLGKDNQALLDGINAVRVRGMEEFGVAATPTFLINGKRYSGDMSVDTMSALIDSLL